MLGSRAYAEELADREAEEAAAKVNQVWEDPVSWWRSAAVQAARRTYCALQAMMVKGSENPYWTQTLTKL